MAPDVLLEADFRALGLEQGAKPSEVKQAYRTLVKKWHPDRHHSKPYETRAIAEKKFREIDEAYRRITGSWTKTAHLAGGRAGYGDRRAAGPGTAPHAAQRPGIKAHAAAVARTLAKIDIGVFSRAKIVVPVLLLAAAVFILTQLPSFFQDNAVDTETLGPPTVEHPPGAKDPNSPEPPETTSPQSSANLTAIPSPVLPSALLQPQPAAPSAFFTLGSTASEVLAIQGAPSRVQGQIWTYGLSEIQFRNGRVSKFNNFDGSLRVRMEPGVSEDRAPPAYITIGSSEEEVLLVQGTPTRLEGDRWFYGFSELVFKNGRVVEYDNYFGNLKIRLLPASLSGPEPPKNFTIGSTPEEVLAVQGTPTAIHGNQWSFDFAIVIFRDGKVHSVTSSDGTLRFIAPEKTGGSQGSSGSG
ncbi:MAG: DnaJ domain-containing protein [Syntrophobacteraceae bacterium]|jgi:hypothetical protein